MGGRKFVYDAEGARIAQGTLSTAPAANATCAPPAASGSSLTSSAGLGLTKRYLVDLGGDQVTELSETGQVTRSTHDNVRRQDRSCACFPTQAAKGAA